jgi:hypothetical protein
MPRTSCSACGNDHPVANYRCPYCVVMSAELEMLTEDAEADNPKSRWSRSDRGVTLSTELAIFRRTVALMLLLMSAVTSLILIETRKSSPSRIRVAEETTHSDSPSELTESPVFPRVTLIQRQAETPRSERVQ